MAGIDKNIKLLQEYFKDARYFETLILGTQLLEVISDTILENETALGEDWLESKMGEQEYKKWATIYQDCQASLKGSYKQNESPRAKVIQIIMNIHTTGSDYFKVDSGLIHKVERVVGFRNDLAHHFFTKGNLAKDLKVRAKECLEIVLLLCQHDLLGVA